MKTGQLFIPHHPGYYVRLNPAAPPDSPRYDVCTSDRVTNHNISADFLLRTYGVFIPGFDMKAMIFLNGEPVAVSGGDRETGTVILMNGQTKVDISELATFGLDREIIWRAVCNADCASIRRHVSQLAGSDRGYDFLALLLPVTKEAGKLDSQNARAAQELVRLAFNGYAGTVHQTIIDTLNNPGCNRCGLYDADGPDGLCCGCHETR